MLVLVYLLLGRLIIWATSVAKPTRKVWSFFEGCDFCYGMWVYFILAFMFTATLNDFSSPLQYVPFASQFFWGLGASFIMHVFVIGWDVKFNKVAL